MIHQLQYIFRKSPILKKIFLDFYHKVNNFNYRLELIQLKKKVNGITFNSFEIIYHSLTDKLLNLILENCKNGETLFDVGAYIGNYTLLFLAKYKNNKVIIFEPNPQSFKKLLKNIKCNNFSDRVRAYNIGLSNYEDTLPFYISSDRARSSFNKYNAKYDGNYIIETKRIQINTLDSIIEELPKPNHVKIDAEGFGLEILQGMKNTISKYQPKIYFEQHEISDKISDNIFRENKIKQFFYEMGYSVIKLGYLWVCTPQDG